MLQHDPAACNKACLDLSVCSSSWGLGRAAVCDCGTPWTFLLLFFFLQKIRTTVRIAEALWSKTEFLATDKKSDLVYGADIDQRGVEIAFEVASSDGKR